MGCLYASVVRKNSTKEDCCDFDLKGKLNLWFMTFSIVLCLSFKYQFFAPVDVLLEISKIGNLGNKCYRFPIPIVHCRFQSCLEREHSFSNCLTCTLLVNYQFSLPHLLDISTFSHKSDRQPQNAELT